MEATKQSFISPNFQTKCLYSQEVEKKAQEVLQDGYSILPRHIPESKLLAWRESFLPLLHKQIELEGTHTSRGSDRYYVTLPLNMVSKEKGMQMIESGETPLEQVLMKLGDVMIRDVRGLHRGTPNRTRIPRPMVVLGYSRRWYFRPEVSIRVPRTELEPLSQRARHLLRFNPVVEKLEVTPKTEVYQTFAY